MAAPAPRSDRTRRWPLALGALAAAAMVATALLDFGDPMERALGEVELGATARGEAVRAAWSRMQADSSGFAAAVGDLDALVLDERPGFMEQAEDRGAEGDVPLAGALARAARMARARGELERAEELAREAAERARGRAGWLFAEVALDRLRWAGAGGRGDEVLVLRADLAEHGDPRARVGGAAVSVLAALVPPIDAGLAFETLTSAQVSLAAPVDRIGLGPDGPAVVWDPWWTTLQERLEQVDASKDWDAVFQREARRGEALRTLFGGVLGGTEDRWSLTRRGGKLFAVRRVAGGTRVVSTSEARIASRLAAVLPVETVQPYSVRFDHEPLPEIDVVREREWLEGAALGFTVHREDPYRSGRIEAARLTAVRAGLVVLAVAILCATLLADRATRRARRLERARSTFVASVSHDLRTPIQSILLMSETLERGRVAGEASRGRYFTTIRQEAERLRRFVEDVLDGARLDQGESARVARQAVDTASFFESLERGLRERAERDSARVEFVTHSLPQELELDPDGTLRIVWNLFENALRHGRGAGGPAEVRIEVDCIEGILSIAVHDRGPGVPARFAQSIFDPFERAAAELGGPTGTGLGLAIVRALARAHGGDAELLPSDQGAHFVARLAVEQPESPEEPAA